MLSHSFPQGSNVATVHQETFLPSLSDPNLLPFLLEVMKRVRSEQIQMAVSCYLKRRQYIDSEGPPKQGLRLCQTAEEMAANLTGNLLDFLCEFGEESEFPLNFLFIEGKC